MRRSAAKHRGNMHAARNGKIAPRAAARLSQPQFSSGHHGMRHASLKRMAVQRCAKISTRQCDHASFWKDVGSPQQSHLQRRGRGRIPHQQIRQTQRYRVRRTRWRHSHSAIPRTAQILHAGLQTGMLHHQRAHRFSSTENSSRVIGWKRTASPTSSNSMGSRSA